jgi:CheY-like chemotaxis protein
MGKGEIVTGEERIGLGIEEHDRILGKVKHQRDIGDEALGMGEVAVGVESTVAVGSAFWVELPHAAAPTPGPAADLAWLAPPGDGAGGRAATVLYIEDNLLNLTLVEQALRFRPQFTLLPAMQGTLGLNLARRHRPDLILLDLNLPDLQGDAVLARLQADPLTRAIPVVIVSADATPGQIERLLAAGAHDYLTKPLQVRRLLDLLDAMLAREAPRR